MTPGVHKTTRTKRPSGARGKSIGEAIICGSLHSYLLMLKAHATSLLLALLCMVSTAMAQKGKPIDPYGEIGITGGVSYYIGDINPDKHLGADHQLAFGGLYRLNLTKRHALRIQALRLDLQAYDSDNEDPDLVNRNLNIKNKLTELSLMLEINYHDYRLGRLGLGFTPYVFGGLSYFQMNPQAEYEGNYFDLMPLGTEGQFLENGPSPYSRRQFAIPFGIGVKAGFTKRLALNLEWGLRRTFTDYLDDVSGVYADPNDIREEAGLQLAADLADPSLQPIGPEGSNIGMDRGNPNNVDWYIYTGLNLSVRLGKDSNGCWK